MPWVKVTFGAGMFAAVALHADLSRAPDPDTFFMTSNDGITWHSNRCADITSCVTGQGVWQYDSLTNMLPLNTEHSYAEQANWHPGLASGFYYWAPAERTCPENQCVPVWGASTIYRVVEEGKKSHAFTPTKVCVSVYITVMINGVFGYCTWCKTRNLPAVHMVSLL